MVELVYIMVIATVAVGVGLTLLRKIGPICDSRAEELVFSLGFGLGAIALGVMGLGFVHLLYAEVLYGLLALGALVGCSKWYLVCVFLTFSLIFCILG